MTDDIGSYRRDGSDTMMEGAHAVAPALRGLRDRVLLLLHASDMTDAELLEIYRERYGGGEYRSLSTRRRELVDRELVMDTGFRKKNPHSGVSNIIWGLTPRGASLLAATMAVEALK